MSFPWEVGTRCAKTDIQTQVVRGCPKKGCRGRGGGKVGRLAGVTRNAHFKARRSRGPRGSCGHVERLIRAWEHVDESQDVIPGGFAGRPLRLVFGLLRLRGDIDGGCPFTDLLLFDGHDYDDGDVSYLLHVRVPDVHRPHGEGKENRRAGESVQLAEWRGGARVQRFEIDQMGC